jgi:hypothetical protein
MILFPYCLEAAEQSDGVIAEKSMETSLADLQLRCYHSVEQLEVWAFNIFCVNDSSVFLSLHVCCKFR